MYFAMDSVFFSRHIIKNVLLTIFWAWIAHEWPMLVVRYNRDTRIGLSHPKLFSALSCGSLPSLSSQTSRRDGKQCVCMGLTSLTMLLWYYMSWESCNVNSCFVAWCYGWALRCALRADVMWYSHGHECTLRFSIVWDWIHHGWPMLVE